MRGRHLDEDEVYAAIAETEVRQILGHAVDATGSVRLEFVYAVRPPDRYDTELPWEYQVFDSADHKDEPIFSTNDLRDAVVEYVDRVNNRPLTHK